MTFSVGEWGRGGDSVLINVAIQYEIEYFFVSVVHIELASQSPLALCMVHMKSLVSCLVNPVTMQLEVTTR